MGWVRIDDGFADHPKMIEAGAEGIALQIAALCYSNRHQTDGKVPRKRVKSLIEIKQISRVIARLLELGIWEEVDGDYIIHDYLEYQPSRAEMDAARDKKARAGKAGAAARWGSETMANAMADAMAGATAAEMPPTQPNPLEIDTSYLSKRSGEKQSLNVVALHSTESVRDALMYVCRIDGDRVPPSVERGYARVVQELQSLGATPDELRTKAAAYRVAFPKAPLTPAALLKHWAAVEGIATQPKISRNDIELEQWARAGDEA